MQTFSHLLQKAYHEKSEQVILYLLESGKEDRPVTYHALVEGAAAYAEAIEQAGIQPGDVVILILQHGSDLIHAFFGAVLCGAIPSIMPFLTEKLLPERYRADLASLISITKPAAILTYPEFESEVRSALVEGDSVRAVIVSDEVAESTVPDFDKLAGLKRKTEDIVLLQHSSGTTGLQKGVALSHQAVFNQLESYSQALNMQPDDVVVSWLPLYHDMGLIAGFLMPILSGIPLVIMSPFEWVRAPYKLMQAVSKYRGTLSWLPNFAYNFCAQKIRERHMDGVDLSSWRAISNCSEPMRWESEHAFFEKFAPYGLRPEAFSTCYAMAENVFAVTQGGIDIPVTVDEIDREALQREWLARPAQAGQPSVKMLSAGKPIPNVEVCILGKDKQPLSERHIGEIALRSNCMLTGYFHRPDVTKKAFHNGWYLTGDYGYLLNGEVFITGRKKDMIIVGGKNIYPQDLELIAMSVPGVHAGRTVAFGIFDAEAGTEEVVLVAEVDSEDPIERERIANDIRQAVTRGSAVALRHVHLVDQKWLVKTSSGKIARSANREKFLKEYLL